MHFRAMLGEHAVHRYFRYFFHAFDLKDRDGNGYFSSSALQARPGRRSQNRIRYRDLLHYKQKHVREKYAHNSIHS